MGRPAKSWTPEMRKAHGEAIRSARKNRTSRSFIRPGWPCTAMQFWEYLVEIYAGRKTVSEVITEEFCISAIRDCAKRMAEEVKSKQGNVEEQCESKSSI